MRAPPLLNSLYAHMHVVQSTYNYEQPPKPGKHKQQTMGEPIRSCVL